MKAVVAEPNHPGALVIADVDEPNPDSDEVVMSVRTFSLNRGELRRAQAGAAGQRIGWDTVGVVHTAARDGSGPPAGARVCAFSRRMQGWSERVALPTRDLAVIPDAVSDEDASTLPVAGLTALYTLERCSRLLAARVLVTGASGGVGYFACQLARLMGAHVTSILRRPQHQAMVEATGAEVFIDADGSRLGDLEPFHAIIDGVGGAQLGRLASRLSEGGRLILYGVSAGADTELGLRELMFTGDGRIEGFHLYRESEVESASRGLTRLMSLMAEGRLQTVVSSVSAWTDVAEVAQGLINRDFAGKAVLTVG
jgi:NADPH:quinone reductase-like Zn-dependent oxidoreductase